MHAKKLINMFTTIGSLLIMYQKSSRGLARVCLSMDLGNILRLIRHNFTKINIHR